MTIRHDMPPKSFFSLPGQAGRSLLSCRSSVFPPAPFLLSSLLATYLFVFVLFVPAMARARPVPADGHRSLLVLYGGPRTTMDDNAFRTNWEFPLNDLGLKAVYLNVTDNRPPPVQDLARYRAVAVSLSGRIRHPAALWAFLEEALKRHKRLLVLGDMPTYRTSTGVPDPQAVRALSRMGFKRMGHWGTNSLRYSVLKKAMTGFELPPPPLPPIFPPISSLRKDNTVWIGLRSGDPQNRGVVSTPVVTGPFGGLALDPFVTRDIPLNPGKEGWVINPFLFLEKALDLRQFPRMDLTTLNGNRIFYSQVDGDGFETLSQYRKGRLCAQVLYREIFSRYALPFTVSVIVSQIDPRYQGTKARERLARTIFSLPNVEAASHTFSHPFYWNPTAKQRAEGPTHIHVPGYRFNLDQEVRISLDWMNRHLVPPGKKVMLFQWSGNTRPGADVLRKVWTYPILNLNGSDTRFDGESPSYLGVFPYYRQVGGYVQFYNSDANEFILTHDWRGPYFAYENILETFARTDSPRRVDPVDVYFHFYIAAKEASLHSLERVLDSVSRQRIAPLFASEFVRVEEGFIRARIRPVSAGRRTGWTISRYGRDTTVRFDHASGLYPDLSRSRGILGFRHRQGSLYLFLALRPSARIFLTRRTPSVPYLRAATGYLLFSRQPGHAVTFTYRGWEPKDRLALGGFPPEKKLALRPCLRGLCIIRTSRSGRVRLAGLSPNVPYRLDPAP